MKTDLKKVLSISGQSGLFLYLSQANAGAIVESLVTKKRTCFGASAKMTSLADISIFTESDEVRLVEVFEKMKAFLGENDAPAGKSDAGVLKAFFEKVLPDYDKERFYTSHMKKVLDWYTCLKTYASLDFENEKEEEEGNTAEEGKAETTKAAKPKVATKQKVNTAAKVGKADTKTKAKAEQKRTKSSAK